MALEIGTRVGVYEVVEKIGQGGMGDVYRAQDTNLGRESGRLNQINIVLNWFEELNERVPVP